MLKVSQQVMNSLWKLFTVILSFVQTSVLRATIDKKQQNMEIVTTAC